MTISTLTRTPPVDLRSPEPMKAELTDRNRVLARRLSYGFLVFLGLLVACTYTDKQLASQFRVILNSIPSVIQVNCGADFIACPQLFCALAVVLFLERFIPVAKGRGTVSRAAYLDAQWVIPKLVFFSSFWLLYIALLRGFYNQHLGFLTIHAVEDWPVWARFMLGFVWVDFLRYFSHRMRHEVQSMWTFHAVHHSQKQLNFFTEWRSHFMDDVLKYTIEAIPLFMLDQGIFQVVLLDRFLYWYSAVYHGNIRSNYGWFRDIVVTPQFHRVHHSIEERHLNRNYGLVLTIWDRMFGTLYKDYNDFPETGTQDAAFPYEDHKSDEYGKTFLEQFFYPFRFPSKPKSAN